MQFRLLGSVDIVDNNKGTALQGARQRTLLAALLINLGNVVAKAQLFDELWGNSVPSGPDNALQAVVARLRRSLRLRFGDRFARERLITTPGGYVFDLEPHMVDVYLFDGLVAEARDVLSRAPIDARELLDRALALWEGPALGGVLGGPICQSAAAQFEETRLTSIEIRVRATIAADGYNAAISELKRLTHLYPWRERLSEMLMISLYLAGRQVEALQEYGSVRDRLIEEFGMEPSPSLKKCMSVILNQESVTMAEWLEHPLAMRRMCQVYAS